MDVVMMNLSKEEAMKVRKGLHFHISSHTGYKIFLPHVKHIKSVKHIGSMKFILTVSI